MGTDDDTGVPVSVSCSGSTATLSFAALPESVYRLTADETIADLAGNQLDGDGNGAAGGNWTTDFVVLPASDLFSTAPTYGSGGSHPGSVAIGDLNGDGRPDLAVTDRFTDYVGVLLGQANGTFASAVVYRSRGDSPAAVAIGDVNGDGRADLVPGLLRHQQRGRALGAAGRDIRHRGGLRLRRQQPRCRGDRRR